MMKYNKAQWMSSFEDRVFLLRPHSSQRMLATMSLMAWSQFGTKDIDPIKAADAWSKSIDEKSAAAGTHTKR